MLADNNDTNLVVITYVMDVKVDTVAEFVEMVMDIALRLSKIGLYMVDQHIVGARTMYQIKIV